MIQDVYPNWPEVNADTLQAIGRFVVAWGVLEAQISEAISDVYNFDYVETMAVTANLGTKAKLELFMAGIGIYREWFPPSMDVRDINKLASDTADIANKYRNMLAHGQPWPLPTETDDEIKVEDVDQGEMFPKQKWIWVRLSARKGGVRITGRSLNRYPFELATTETVNIIERWTQFRLDAIGPLTTRNEMPPELLE